MLRNYITCKYIFMFPKNKFNTIWVNPSQYFASCCHGNRNCYWQPWRWVRSLGAWINMMNMLVVNTLWPRQNSRHFADNIFKCIFLNGNARILIAISLKFVPRGPFNNIPALVQIMAWHWPGDKPLYEPMMVSLPTHICVTRPQWVNKLFPSWTTWQWTCR